MSKSRLENEFAFLTIAAMKIYEHPDFAVPLVLFGVPFHNVTFEETIEWIQDRVRRRQPSYIVTANVDFLMQAWNDPELQRILIEADLVVADGMPVVKASSWFGQPLKERVTGSDLVPMLGKTAVADGMSIYCLGGDAGVPEAAAKELQHRNPGLKIAGTYSPPYLTLLEMDHESLVQRIEENHPDILLVALGSPKQEKFINMHFRNWSVPVSIGIGATLDYLTGVQKRAPLCFQKIGMEWFWRMLSDPKRLVKRYMTNLEFLISASFKLGSVRSIMNTRAQVDEPNLVTRWQERMIAVHQMEPVADSAAAVQLLTKLNATLSRAPLVLDLRGISWLDSLELGVLLELGKRCHQQKQELFVYGAGHRVAKLLKTCRLDLYLHITNSAREIEHRIGELKQVALNAAVRFEDGCLLLNLPAELTASTLSGYRELFEEVWNGHDMSQELSCAKVDCSAMGFIDSSGIGFFMDVFKRCEMHQVPVSFDDFQEIPLKILKVARVDRIFSRNQASSPA